MKLFAKPFDIPWNLFWENKMRKKMGNGMELKQCKGSSLGQVHVSYRISERGNAKVKLNNINNENCLKNAVNAFPPDQVDWKIICDGCGEATMNMVRRYLPAACIEQVEVGHGAGTFNLALDWALGKDAEDIVYFLENDYLHTADALDILLDGFQTGAEIVTLYDHPDKYDEKHPLFQYMQTHTKIYIGQKRHWKTAFSTTMTFAAKVGFLRLHEKTMRKWTQGKHPFDFAMFNELLTKGVCLISPMPGASTHGEVAFLGPLVDWERVQ